jgi:hypothetical protein
MFAEGLYRVIPFFKKPDGGETQWNAFGSAGRGSATVVGRMGRGRRVTGVPTLHCSAGACPAFAGAAGVSPCTIRVSSGAGVPSGLYRTRGGLGQAEAIYKKALASNRHQTPIFSTSSSVISSRRRS